MGVSQDRWAHGSGLKTGLTVYIGNHIEEIHYLSSLAIHPDPIYLVVRAFAWGVEGKSLNPDCVKARMLQWGGFQLLYDLHQCKVRLFINSA